MNLEKPIQILVDARRRSDENDENVAFLIDDDLKETLNNSPFPPFFKLKWERELERGVRKWESEKESKQEREKDKFFAVQTFFSKKWKLVSIV